MRLGISLQTLLQSTGLAAGCTGDPTWWLRPGATVLARIGRTTDTDAEKLLSMTFAQWEPAIHHDDDSVERFYPPRQLPISKARRQSAQQIVLCTQCLRDDTEPYLRLPWMLAWTALCPKHATVLTSRCPHCQASLKLAALMSPCTPRRCGSCHNALSNADTRPTHEQALELQAALLAAKRHGSSELAGLGMMSWPLATAALEILLGLAWTPTLCRGQLYRYIRRDFDLGGDFDAWHGRYGNLLLVAWLLDRWPRNLRACVGMLRASRPSTRIEQHHHFPPDIRTRLREIFQPVSYVPRLERRRHHRTPPPWRSWLDHLPITGEELRARAYRERLKHRRVRLIALAGLRDGRSVKTVAAAIGMRPKTVCDWLHEGARNGLEALLERRLGRQLLSSAQVAEIAEWLACRPLPGSAGFRVIRPADVIAESAGRFGIQITRTLALTLFRTHITSRRWRRPRPYPIRAMDSRIRESVQH
jgi:transposase